MGGLEFVLCVYYHILKMVLVADDGHDWLVTV
jgi:hypothetical protein